MALVLAQRPVCQLTCLSDALLAVPRVSACRQYDARSIFSRDHAARQRAQRYDSGACRHSRQQGRWHTAPCCAASGSQQPILSNMDANQLQTALQIAVDSEDFAQATAIRDALKVLRADAGGASWQSLGVPEWLADRAEQYGLRFPTAVQAEAAAALQQGRDCVIRSETGSGKTLSFLLPLLAQLDFSHTDVKGPQLLVVVPTRELGVQIAMLVFKLFGGSVNPGIPGQAGNMFAFKGPKDLKVRGLLAKDEVLMAKNSANFFDMAHVLVATPAALSEVLAPPQAADFLENVHFVVVDEVDACFQPQTQSGLQPDPLTDVLNRLTWLRRKPPFIFVGATVQDGTAARAQQNSWMQDPAVVAVGEGGIPASLTHVSILCEETRQVAVLCRKIRQDLIACAFLHLNSRAAALAEPLRNALWGDHKISVLLPGGEEPIMAMHAFRDNKASLLVATPSSARGLDLPAVQFVYNLGPPADATDFLHRAGRAGRIGTQVSGTTVTLVSEAQQPALQNIAAELGINIERVPEPERPQGVEGQKKELDDLWSLF